MEDQIADFAGVDLNALRFGFAAVNDGGNTPFRAKFLCPSPASERTGKRVQWYRFHFLKLFRLRSSQLVRPPLNSNSEFTDELLWIRLIASPKSPATERVVIFTPLITGRRTVSVVISSSIEDFRKRSIPTSFKIAWETHARIFLAPLRFS